MNKEFVIVANVEFEDAELSIVNAVGQSVYEQLHIIGSKIKINLANNSTGTYFIQIRDGQKFYRTRFVKM